MEKSPKANAERKFNLEAFAIIAVVVSVVFMLFSSAILGAAPRGRVTQVWAPLGIDKLGWDNISAAFNIMFWVALLGYAYLKREIIKEHVLPCCGKEGFCALSKRWRTETIAAVALAVFMIVAAAFQVPPVSSFASWRNSVNNTVSGWFAAFAPEDEMEKMMRKHREDMESRMRNPRGPDAPAPKPPAADGAAQKAPDADGAAPPIPHPFAGPDGKLDPLRDREEMMRKHREEMEKRMQERMRAPAPAPAPKATAPNGTKTAPAPAKATTTTTKATDKAKEAEPAAATAADKE